MNKKELIKWIMLAENKKIKNRKKLELLNEYKDINKIFKILNIKENIEINKYVDFMEKHNIKTLCFYDKNYPNGLKRLYDAPILIYAMGNVNILNDEKSIAVIGARNASNYGIYVSQRIGQFLSRNNINTISGLALGIDVNSHVGVLKENYINCNSGKAIAVVGNGLDNIYPKKKKKIARDIINTGGCIISEYIVGTKPTKNNFPARNRIISALSNKLIVVEAESEKSGTMITVDFSLDLGKDVLVIPGNITSKTSIGTNKLIKSGAKIITELNDIICEEY